MTSVSPQRFKSRIVAPDSMLLLDLPLELVEEIITLAAWDEDLSLYRICQLREVNRLFERAVIKTLARYRIGGDEDLPTGLPESLQIRLITEFLRKQNKGHNDLASHLHSVSESLADLSTQLPHRSDRPASHEEWLLEICRALARCSFTEVYGRMVDFGEQYWIEAGKESEAIAASSFLFAGITGHTDVQKKLIQAGVNVRVSCAWGKALDCACRLGDQRAVKWLLNAGALNPNPELPVIIAMMTDQAEVLDLLLDARRLQGKILARSPFSNPIVLKRLSKSYECLRLVLNAYPAELSTRDRIELFGRIATHGWEDLMKKMIEYESPFRQPFEEKAAVALFRAVEGGQFRTCRFLLHLMTEAEKEANLHHLSKIPWVIAAGGSVEVLELLQRSGHCINSGGRAAIVVIAADQGHLSMLCYALEHAYHLAHGNPPYLQLCALVAAIFSDHPSIVELLLHRLSLHPNSELDLNIPMEKIPLLLAISEGAVEVVRLLMVSNPTVDEDAVRRASLQKSYLNSPHRDLVFLEIKELLSRYYSGSMRPPGTKGKREKALDIALRRI